MTGPTTAGARAGGRDLTVIVLTLDEERTLPGCLESLAGLGCQVVVVDSGSTDGTIRIARECGCDVYEHPFENYGAQRNWAFENVDVRGGWTLCIDADERLTEELRRSVIDVVDAGDVPEDGFLLTRRTVFMGRWLKHGGQYPAYHLRLFRTGRGRCEDRLYDQHFMVDGPLGRLEGDLIDVLGADIGTWLARHVRWAELEAIEVSRPAVAGANIVDGDRRGNAIARRRFLRNRIYYRFPRFLRPFLFFFYGYVARLGFLDGIPGLVFHVHQRFWFRFLIDCYLWRLERHRDR